MLFHLTFQGYRQTARAAGWILSHVVHGSRGLDVATGGERIRMTLLCHSRYNSTSFRSRHESSRFVFLGGVDADRQESKQRGLLAHREQYGEEAAALQEMVLYGLKGACVFAVLSPLLAVTIVSRCHWLHVFPPPSPS